MTRISTMTLALVLGAFVGQSALADGEKIAVLTKNQTNPFFQAERFGAAKAADVKAGTVQGGKESLLGTAEEVEALDGAAFDGTGSGKTVERSDASREVVQTGEVFEIAAVATEQDVTEVGEAVNVLFDGSEGVACWTRPALTPCLNTTS